MPKKADTGRVILDAGGKAALEGMLVALRQQESCVRVTSSRLASWIIERYAGSGFERDKDAIVRDHFNSKEYLKKMVSTVGKEGGDLAGALETALQKIRSEAPRRRRGRKRGTQASGTNVSHMTSFPPDEKQKVEAR